MKVSERLTTWLACSAFALIAVPALAVGTRRFVLQDGDDFQGGDLKGVAVDAAGRVHAGFNLGAVPVADGVTIWSALPMPDGSVLLGTGNDGKLVRVQGAVATTVADTKTLAVTSLTSAWNGAVVLGTLPEGKVMKWAGGKLTDLATLKGSDHVWQVAYDKKSNAVLAATGPEGKLWRITADGQAQVYFDAEEPHLMSLAIAADGTVYAGASDKAKLYKITGPGRASVLYDFARTEVRAIAVGPKGDVYAVANEIRSGSDAPKRGAGGRRPDAPAAPVSTGPKTKGKGVLYHFSPDGAPEQLLDFSDDYFTSLALGDDGKPYAGTGAEGRVYTVDDSHNSVLVADTQERQVGALVLSGKQHYVASSDPAVLHPVRGIGGADAVWTSKVLDAGLRASFGKLSWEATGAIEFSTRSGGTKEPDSTWSDWSRPAAAPGPIESPPARYLQVRARWTRDPKSVLSEVEIPFVTDNLRAYVTQINVGNSPRNKGSSSGTSSSIEASGGPLSEKPSSSVSLDWKTDNPDKDEMRYRLQYRLVGTNVWYDMLKSDETLTKESYSWDTADLPEGRYRVRVIASDELSNPPDRVKTHELESGIVLVDNTPPVVEGLRVTGTRIQGTAIDGVGPIARIEASIAGSSHWFPFYPRDGLFDEQREEFDIDVAPLGAKAPAIVALRVYDAANNSVVYNVTLK